MCDDGNDVETDGCVQSCQRSVCGDGYVQEGEECDTGMYLSDNDGCTTSCKLNVCGDGLVRTWGMEECDDGAANADDGACTSTCLRNICGDALLHVGVEGA